MESRALGGVIPVLVTPFGKRDEVDVESLNRLVDFNLAAGVGGISLAFGSELFKLDDSERDTLVGMTVRRVAGSVPVIVQANGGSTMTAARTAARAEDLGADVIMSAPPPGAWSDEELIGYYGGIARAITVPLMVQDGQSAPVRPRVLGMLTDRYPHVIFGKVETSPTAERVRAACEETKGKMTILGGAGGNFLLEELRRGSEGTMPSCSLTDEFVSVWSAWKRGDDDAATGGFLTRILPLNRMITGGLPQFYHVHKYVLWKRGLIKEPRVRSPSAPLDKVLISELDRLLNRMGIL